MKTFDEMLATPEDKRELNRIILETPELKAKSHKLVKLDDNVRKAVTAITVFGSFDQFPECPVENKHAINRALEQIDYRVINYEKLRELVDMAANPLRFEAYKILCEREKEGDAS